MRAIATENDMLANVPFGLAFAVAAIAAISSAVADDKPNQMTPVSCVRTASISDWKPVDATHIIISTGPQHDYRVAFTSRCYHMKWSVFARVDTRPTRDMACLSRGDVMLFGRGPRRSDNSFEQEERCVVKSVEAVQAEPSSNQ
jgi:hypothetical protein